MKVVLDTNILVSALITRGKSKKLFDKILEKELDLVLSQEILLELKEVLTRPNRFVNLINKNLSKISSDFDVTADIPRKSHSFNSILIKTYSAQYIYS